MKKLILAVAVMLGFTAAVWANGPKEYKINTEKSQVLWNGKKVTGEHFGTLNLVGGEVKTSGSDITATTILMDMTSITVTDIEDPGYNAKLVGHLKSDDFFSSEAYNQATFVATSIKAIKNAKAGEANYTVTGNLTIKGITNKISFPAIVSMTDSELNAEGKATFDRTKWNIQYGSGSFFDDLGDTMIYDDINITFKLVATASN